jgi:hypothetical protein
MTGRFLPKNGFLNLRIDSYILVNRTPALSFQVQLCPEAEQQVPCQPLVERGQEEQDVQRVHGHGRRRKLRDDLFTKL